MPKNYSFIDVNEQLTILNVSNRWFFLNTINPIVKDLDPYSDKLTYDEIDAISDECEQNIWYFLRDIIRVKDADGNISKYRLDLTKLASIYCSINNISNHPLALESQGTMESTACLILWEILFKKDYKKIILNDIYEYGEKMYFLIKDISSLLPEYISRRLVFDDDNRKIHSDGIQKLFPSEYPITKRNITNIINENLDNISIYPNFENMEINTDLIRREELVKKSYTVLPSYIVSDNSKNKTDVNMFVKSSLRWDEVFLDLDIDTLKSYLKRHSLTNFIYIQYKYEELGFTKDYMREHNLSNPNFSRLNKPDIVEAEKAREEAEKLREQEIDKLINMNVTAELLPPESDINVSKTVDNDSIDLHFMIPRAKASDSFSYDDLSPEQKEDLLSGTYSKEDITSMLERLQYYGDINVLPVDSLWEYEYNDDDTITLTAYKGFDSTIVIPYSINGYMVSGVSDGIFIECENIDSIIIPNSIKTIASEMFSNCMDITDIKIPSGVSSIGDNAFSGCSNLQTVYVPNTVKSIGANAFPTTATIILESSGSVAEGYVKENNLSYVYDTISSVPVDDETIVDKDYLETRLVNALDGGEI